MTEEFKEVVEQIKKNQLINLFKQSWRFEFDSLHTALNIYAETFHVTDIQQIGELLRDYNMTGFISSHFTPKGEICFRIVSMKISQLKSLLS